MADRIWTGNAQASRLGDRYTPPLTATTAYGVEVNKKQATWISGTSAPTMAEVIAQVKSAIEGSEYPEVRELSVLNEADTTLQIQGPADGKPVTYTAIGLGTAIGVSTANGPNWVDNADNWEPAVAPSGWSAGDRVILDGGPSLLYALDALQAVELGEWIRRQTFTNQIGLTVAGNGYPEYRPRYLMLNSLVSTLGGSTLGGEAGPSAEHYDYSPMSANPPAIIVLNTGVKQSGDYLPVQLQGMPSGTTMLVRGGAGIDVCRDPLATGEINAYTINGGHTRIGEGTILTNAATTFLMRSGRLELNKQMDGVIDTYGGTLDAGPRSALLGSVRMIQGGTINYRGIADVPNLKMDSPQAIFDATGTEGPLAVTVELLAGTLRGNLTLTYAAQSPTYRMEVILRPLS